MPRVADTQVDVADVLERLGIDVVADRGTWGDALCPFHYEFNPSFSVNLDEGAWVCRHGEEKGQLLDLVARVRGCSKREATLWVRNLVPVHYTATDVLVKLFQLSKETGQDMSAMLEWSERYEALDPKLMSEYFFERGFSTETMRDFGVRYDEKENSLVWPVRDEAANLVGFIKRRIPPTVGARYEYPKGFQRVLYPLDHFEGSEAILVEGPLDALWLHQCGHRGALAALGSGLTKSQLLWVRRNTTSVTLIFDNDRDGKLGQEKVIKQLAGMRTFVAKLPKEVKDPQELSKDRLRTTLEETTPALFSVIKGYNKNGG